VQWYLCNSEYVKAYVFSLLSSLFSLLSERDMSVADKRKVSGEIKEYIRQILLPSSPYTGEDGMFYEA
jgi:hypothetical protein